MAESILSMTIFVNDLENKVCFYTNKDRSNSQATASYQSAALDTGFFDEFSRILVLYKRKFGYKTVPNVSLLLPDHLFLTDTVTIPNMGKKAVENSLNLVIGTVYKNKDELDYNTFPLLQTKQNEVYGLVGARKVLLQDFRDVCLRNSFQLQNITFVSNAMADGAMSINQKLRTATCLLLDIKEANARFAFMSKGRTLGAYTLPFGYSILSCKEAVNESSLFDNKSASRLVRSAKEKARATSLDASVSFDEDIFAFPGNTEGQAAPSAQEAAAENSCVQENFRIFVKWTLELLSANGKLPGLEGIDTVYVNLPVEYQYLLDQVNKEQAENGVVFAPMFTGGAAPKILEMLGGLQVKQYNKLNNF